MVESLPSDLLSFEGPTDFQNEKAVVQNGKDGIVDVLEMKNLFLWNLILGKVVSYYEKKEIYLLVFERGSLGPSTVTLIALAYVATWGGELLIMIVKVKLLPRKKENDYQIVYK